MRCFVALAHRLEALEAYAAFALRVTWPLSDGCRAKFSFLEPLQRGAARIGRESFSIILEVARDLLFSLWGGGTFLLSRC